MRGKYSSGRTLRDKFGPTPKSNLSEPRSCSPRRIIGEVLLYEHPDLIEDGWSEADRAGVEQPPRLITLCRPPRRGIIAVCPILHTAAVTVGIHEPASRLPSKQAEEIGRSRERVNLSGCNERPQLVV